MFDHFVVGGDAEVWWRVQGGGSRIEVVFLLVLYHLFMRRGGRGEKAMG